MKKLALTAALFAATSFGAYAQTATPPETAPTPAAPAPSTTAPSPAAPGQAPAPVPPGTDRPAMPTLPGSPGADNRAPGITGGPAGETMVPEGFIVADETVRTADNLTGARVYDTEESRIGRVSDLVLGDNDQVTHLVLDIGGFLGIGSHTVALPMDDVNVFWNPDDRNAMVRVDMTRDQLRELPEFKK